MTQKEITERAIEYAKAHKKMIAKAAADLKRHPPSKLPISLFMAGSPGAGKTEYSLRLLKGMQKKQVPAVLIDGDELRNFIPGYTGNNSKLFQGAISIMIGCILDFVHEHRQNFILDGTFSHYEIAQKNVERSLKRKRHVVIFYVYQDPQISWRFTQAREKLEGRNIPKKAFIEQFFSSRDTVNKLYKEFGDQISVYLVEKDLQPRKIKRIYQLSLGETIDQYIPSLYTVNTLKKLL